MRRPMSPTQGRLGGKPHKPLGLCNPPPPPLGATNEKKKLIVYIEKKEKYIAINKRKY